MCVYSSIPFPNLEKSAHVTDGFKICSPNFTLFKNGFKKPLFPNSYQTEQKQTKTEQNKTKRLVLAVGAKYKLIQPLIGFKQWVYGSFQTWLQYLDVYVQKLQQFNAKTKSVL